MKSSNFINKIKHQNKSFALLIDPDKYSDDSLIKLLKKANIKDGPDFIFVGGSLLFKDISLTIELIKDHCDKPIYIFPGNQIHISENADGILFLSLISGRNPELLIGNHVLAAPKLQKTSLDVIPTGYVLIDCGTNTSVSYISNTNPIPSEKNDIALATALAGEYLGLKCIYLEGGSGAKHPINDEMISKIKENINIPIIVGGGIKSATQLQKVYDAGADLVVVGNILEKSPNLLDKFIEIKNSFNRV